MNMSYRLLLLLISVFACSLLAKPAPIPKSSAPEWSPVQGQAQGTDERMTENGVSFLRVITQKEGANYLIQNDKLYSSIPGSPWILTFKARSTVAAKNSVRAGVFFYDEKGRRLRTGTPLMHCGGNSEWKEYVYNFILPDNAAYYRITMGVLKSAGSADFTDFRLRHNSGKVFAVPNHDFTSDKPAPRPPAMERPKDAVWSYYFQVKGVHNYLHFTGLELDAELVQFDKPESLRYLTAQGTARSMAAMPYMVTSSRGSCFWFICNMDKLEQSYVLSNESIPLEGGLKQTAFTIPFGNVVSDWMATLAKGAHAIRSHYNYMVMDKGKTIASANVARPAIDAQATPEAAFFGDSRNENAQVLRAGLFTLADLTKYEIAITDFRSSGKPEGEFAFRMEVTDAAGESFAVNRVKELTVLGDGEKLPCEMKFDRYSIPSGWFVGRFGKTLPKQITVSAHLRAALREGIRPVEITAAFPAAATREPMPVFEKKHCIRQGEGRIMTFNTGNLPRDPAVGKKIARDVVAKIAASNYTELIVSTIGSRAVSDARLSNPHLKYIHEWDTLQVLREETRKHNIKFTAMLSVLPEGVSAPVGWLAKHPECAMHSPKGEVLGWLDPAVPEVREYRIKDILEIIQKYDVDGIQLDYMRLRRGPSDRGAEIYMKQFGKDPRKFKDGSEEYKQWFQWEGEQLTQMVREIRAAIKKVKPNIELSAYVQGSRYSQIGEWLENHQPMGNWLKEGLLDYIAPTGYVYDMLRFKCWSRRQIEYCKRHNPKTPVYITLGVRSTGGALKDAEELIDQIDYAQELGADGVEFFHWHVTTKFNEQLVRERYYAPSQKPAAQQKK